MPTFQRICILGVGLLGGSLGMAAKSADPRRIIVGWGHRIRTLQRAREIGAIDEFHESAELACKGADLIVLCTPVGTFESLLNQIARAVKRGAVVTDVGSTKQTVVRIGERLLKGKAHFVGSHPMAGSEKRGIEYARADLFNGASCIVTPTAKTNAPAREAVEKFWRGIGMRITRLSPAVHDRLLADVSHLPHAVAAALVAMQEEDAMELAGKGFLDTTRIAGGDGALWRDIFLDNAKNMKSSLRRLRKKLVEFEKLLSGRKGEKLAIWLASAAARRAEVLKGKLSEVTPD